MPCNPEPAIQGLIICWKACCCKPRQIERAMKAGPQAILTLEPRELRKEATVKESGIWLEKILLEPRKSVQFVTTCQPQMHSLKFKCA